MQVWILYKMIEWTQKFGRKLLEKTRKKSLEKKTNIRKGKESEKTLEFGLCQRRLSLLSRPAKPGSWPGQVAILARPGSWAGGPTYRDQFLLKKISLSPPTHSLLSCAFILYRLCSAPLLKLNIGSSSTLVVDPCTAGGKMMVVMSDWAAVSPNQCLVLLLFSDVMTKGEKKMY